MIRLAMITYNEADNLPIIAKSLEGIIDSWVILDDAKSNDGTRDVAKEVFKDIPGRALKSGSLKSFAEERNKLLKYARQGLTDQDYILIIDPDDRPEGFIPTLDTSIPLYFCTYYTGTLEWQLPILLRADHPFFYTGAAHELLNHDGIDVAVVIPDFRVARINEGGSTPARKNWVIDLLSKEPDNPRSVFYLARTYQDNGDFPNALYQFLRRINMESIDEQETWYSYFVAAVIAMDIDKATAELLCHRAIGIRPSRKEPYYLLAHLYNELKMYELALEKSQQALALPPSADIMFVDRWIEHIGIRIEHHTARVGLGLAKQEDVVDASNPVH